MISKVSLVALKTLTVYLLLVLIQDNVEQMQFEGLYYAVVFLSMYVWMVDFGAFFYTSRNGIKIAGEKIARNILLQIVLSPIILYFLSFYFTPIIAVHIGILGLTSYLLLILRGSLISKNKIIEALLVDFASLIPVYGAFYFSTDLLTALSLCIVIHSILITVSWRAGYLKVGAPTIHFDEFDMQMFLSNFLSTIGSYIDVFFARFFVSDFSSYVLVRELVMKIPSFLSPLYNNIVYPVLLNNLRSFDKFYISNAAVYISAYLFALSLMYFFPPQVEEIVKFLGVFAVLKGLSSLHGALTMSKMASNLNMTKNLVFLVVFVFSSAVSLKLEFDFKGWMSTLIVLYGIVLAYDVFILLRLEVASWRNSLLVFSCYVTGLLLCFSP